MVLFVSFMSLDYIIHDYFVIPPLVHHINKFYELLKNDYLDMYVVQYCMFLSFCIVK